MPPRKKRADAVDPEDQVLEDEDEDTEDDEELTTKVAKKAARRVARTTDEDDDTEDDDDDEEKDDEDEVLATDAEVREWLESVVKTPEIQKIIRKASREIAASAVDRSVTEVRDQLEADFQTRLDKITSDLGSGRITSSEADDKATTEAERAAAKAVDDPEKFERELKAALAERDRASERDQQESVRETKRRRREVDIYKREALLNEDKTSMIPEMVVITDGTTEEDVDEMIEVSKETFTKVRKSVIKQLRTQGWKSPKDLRTAEDNRDEEDEDDDTDIPGGPPSRDARSEELSKDRKSKLRARFRYGAGTGATR